MARLVYTTVDQRDPLSTGAYVIYNGTAFKYKPNGSNCVLLDVFLNKRPAPTGNSPAKSKVRPAQFYFRPPGKWDKRTIIEEQIAKHSTAFPWLLRCAKRPSSSTNLIGIPLITLPENVFEYAYNINEEEPIRLQLNTPEPTAGLKKANREMNEFLKTPPSSPSKPAHKPSDSHIILTKKLLIVGQLCLVEYPTNTDNDLLKSLLIADTKYRAVVKDSKTLLLPVTFAYSKEDCPQGIYIENNELEIPYSYDLTVTPVSAEQYYGIYLDSTIQWLDSTENKWIAARVERITDKGVEILVDKSHHTISGFVSVYRELRVIDDRPIIHKSLNLHPCNATLLHISGENLTEETFLSFSLSPKKGAIIPGSELIPNYIRSIQQKFDYKTSGFQVSLDFIAKKIEALGECELLCLAIKGTKKSIKIVPVCTIGQVFEKFGWATDTGLPYWKIMSDSKPLLQENTGKSWQSRVGKYGFHNPRSNFIKEKQAHNHPAKSVDLISEETATDEPSLDSTDSPVHCEPTAVVIEVDCQSHYLLQQSVEYSKEYRASPFTVKIGKLEEIEKIRSMRKPLFVQFYATYYDKELVHKKYKKPATLSIEAHKTLLISCEFPWELFFMHKDKWAAERPWRVSLVHDDEEKFLDATIIVQNSYSSILQAKQRVNLCDSSKYKVFNFLLKHNEKENTVTNISIPKKHLSSFLTSSENMIFNINQEARTKTIMIFSASYMRAKTATLDYEDIMYSETSELLSYFHFIIVREEEFVAYRNIWGSSHIILSLSETLPFDASLGMTPKATDGVGFARRFIYDVAKQFKIPRYWMTDDNISGFCQVGQTDTKKIIPWSFGSIIRQFEQLFKPDETSSAHRNGPFLPYNNDTICKKKLASCFQIYEDGPASHLEHHYDKERRISAGVIKKEKSTPYLTVEEFSGPSDRYAVIGLRQWNYFRRSPAQSFCRSHAMCAVLINIEAIEKVNATQPVQTQIRYPSFPIAEDMKFNDYCDFHGLWVCRASRFQFLKPQGRKRNDNWKSDYLLLFRLKYDTQEIECPYIRLVNFSLEKTDQADKAIRIPLRIYATCFHLFETLNNVTQLKPYFKGASSVVLSINNHTLLKDITGAESTLSVLRFLEREKIDKPEDGVYDLTICCNDNHIFKPVVSTDVVEFELKPQKEIYNMYDSIEIHCRACSGSNAEIKLAIGLERDYPYSYQCVRLPANKHNNTVILKEVLTHSGKILITALANQQKVKIPFVKFITVQHLILGEADHVFSNHRLTFSKIAFNEPLQQYLKKNVRLRKEFEELLTFYKTTGLPPIGELETIRHHPNGARLAQVMSYIAVLRYYSTEKDNTEHPVICLPTGLGKSLTALMIPFQIAQKRAIIIAPTLAILNGYRNYFPSDGISFLEQCGLLSSEAALELNMLFWIPNCGNPIPENYSNSSDPDKSRKLHRANIIVITFQSLSSVSDDIVRARCEIDLLVIDECHHAGAQSYGKIRKNFPNCKVVGFSATPTDQKIKISEDKKESMKVVLRIPVLFGIETGEIKQLKVSLLEPTCLSVEKALIESNDNHAKSKGKKTDKEDKLCINCNKEKAVRGVRKLFCAFCTPSMYLQAHGKTLRAKGLTFPSGISMFVERGTGASEEQVNAFFNNSVLDSFYSTTYSRSDIESLANISSFRRMITEIQNHPAPPTSSLCHIIDESIFELERRNQSISSMTVPPQAIVICRTLKQLSKLEQLYKERIKDLFADRKISTLFTVGDASRINISKLMQGQLHIIIQCKKLAEGFDHKPLCVAVVLRPIRSLTPFYQFVGRVMRTVPNASEQSGTVILHKATETHLLWERFQNMDIEGIPAFKGLPSSKGEDFTDAYVSGEVYNLQTLNFAEHS